MLLKDFLFLKSLFKNLDTENLNVLLGDLDFRLEGESGKEVRVLVSPKTYMWRRKKVDPKIKSSVTRRKHWEGEGQNVVVNRYSELKC